MSTEYIKDLIRVLPAKPGVYQFVNKEDKVIYVGKAKNLKNRVSSYFSRGHFDNYKLKVLVGQVSDIRHLVTNTESDALLLENNLIKKYQPRYNILLKDDKSFPFLCVRKEPFPRVFPTRNPVMDGSEYFGPYTSMVMVRTLMELIRQLYPLRNCKLLLTGENIRKMKFKVCLEYHLGNCKAPCVGLQTEEEYLENVNQIRTILRGNILFVMDFLKIQMKEKSEMLQFEAAQTLKEKYEILKHFQAKSAIVNASVSNVDVFSFVEKEGRIAINFLQVMGGAVIKTHTVETKRILDESREEILLHAILSIREKAGSSSPVTILPFDPKIKIESTRFVIPQKGEKKKLAELSERNARYFLLERIRMAELKDPSEKAASVLRSMMQDLRLTKPPEHIECFDNSNIQGDKPVSSCVVFLNGKPAKTLYRHYNIRTVSGPDDFASMEEVILRRYERLLSEGKKLPDLVVVDGGKGQLSSALKSLKKLKLQENIPVISIAKRLEEIYFPGDPVPVYLDKNSVTLKIIQQLRNEAHRFAISFHRTKRSQNFTKSELSNIPGIGEKTASRLLAEFGSVRRIRQSTRDELERAIGRFKTKLIEEYFGEKNRK